MTLLLTKGISSCISYTSLWEGYFLLHNLQKSTHIYQMQLLKLVVPESMSNAYGVWLSGHVAKAKYVFDMTTSSACKKLNDYIAWNIQPSAFIATNGLSLYTSLVNLVPLCKLSCFYYAFYLHWCVTYRKV